MKLKAIKTAGLILFSIITATIVSCQNEAQVEFQRYYSNGSAIYQSHCQNCHGAHGEGLQALIPPLNDTAFIKTNKAALACYIKNGLKRKILVSNRGFEGEMPGNDLAPVELAEVITYVSNSFGNKSATTKSQQVENDLNACR